MGYPALYLIADPNLYGGIQTKNDPAERTFFSALESALAAGVRLVQYRDKETSRLEKYRIALRMREVTRCAGAIFIVNDDIDVAMAVQADGVHLGQDDFPPEMARKLMGEKAIIGLSTHNLLEVKSAVLEPINYIGFGPIFETNTKAVLEPRVGLESIEAIARVSNFPVYAIGGIQREHCPSIRAAGVAGVAVASGLKDAEEAVVKSWLSALSD